MGKNKLLYLSDKGKKIKHYFYDDQKSAYVKFLIYYVRHGLKIDQSDKE